VAGALAIGSLRGDGAAPAAPGKDDDRILAFFLTLEQVQEDLYRRALDAGGIDGELRELATAVAGQEREHVKLLLSHLDERLLLKGQGIEYDAVTSPDAFLKTAIDLEEAAIAAYVGQAGNLGRDQLGSIARLVSVEARQAAWLRDIAGEMPAPHVADPARSPDQVLAALRDRSYIL